MSRAAGWGYNAQAQIGNGTTSKLVLAPSASVALGERIKAMATGGNYTLAHLADGTVLSVGDNVNGALCTGDLVSAINARPSLLSRVKQLEADGGHGIALLDDGTVVTWGSNSAGQIGDGQSGQGEANKSFNRTTPYDVGLAQIARVRAGGAVCGALDAKGGVWLWGENRLGAAGVVGASAPAEVLHPTLLTLLGQPLPPFIDFCLGGSFTLNTHGLGLTALGTLFGWGAGRDGCIIDPTGRKASETQALPPTAIPGIADVIKIEAGTAASYALTAAGDLFAWGKNTRFQLGIAGLAVNATEPKPTLVFRDVSDFSVGGGTGALISRGEVFTWGGNQYGECGQGQAGTDVPTPTAIASLGDVEGILVGMTHMLAILRGPAPPPPLKLVAEPGALVAEWESEPVTGKWEVSWRLAHTEGPKVKQTIDDPACRSARVTGLASAAPVEVTVHNAEWGRATAEGTPL